MTKNAKLCRDCQFYTPARPFRWVDLFRPQGDPKSRARCRPASEVDLVTGERLAFDPHYMRAIGKCGEDGLLFQKKPESDS